jgi:hypothetical protein
MEVMISRGKSGNGGNDGNGIRRNQATSSRDRGEEDLLDQIDALKAKNKKLQGQLDEIRDVIECDDSECNDSQHLDTIADILGGNGRE